MLEYLQVVALNLLWSLTLNSPTRIPHHGVIPYPLRKLCIVILVELLLLTIFFSVLLFAVVLVAFCGASYLEVVNFRDDQVPRKADFLAALLPLMCIPALLSLCSGLVKW